MNNLEQSDSRENYKEVRIGPKTIRLPVGWRMTSLDPEEGGTELVTDGSHYSPDQDKDEDYHYATVSNLSEFGINFESCGKINEKQFNEMVEGGCKPESGDVLFSKDGTVGISTTFSEARDVVLLSSIAIIRPNSEIFISEYLSKFLSSKLTVDQIRSFKSGTALRRVILGDIKKFQIPTPPLTEQRRIANILSKVDEQIQQTDAMITKTAELKRGLMQDLVTGGIDHTSYKETLLGPKEVQIPDTWAVEQMGDVADIVSGGTPKKSTQEYWGGDIVWVTPTDVTAIEGMHISDSAEKITEQGLEDSSTHLLEPGAVLMTSRATIGEAVINTVPVTTNQGFKSLVPGDCLHNEYLYYYVHTIADYLTEIGGGSTFPEINKTDTQSIRVPIPPLDEQKRIADILNQADKKRLEERERRQKLQELKRGLMQDLLTGKVRVDPDN